MTRVPLFLLVIGCNSVDVPSLAYQQDPCLTSGATYEIVYVAPDGGCLLPPTSFQYSAGFGTFSAPAGCVDRGSYDGCTQHIDKECTGRLQSKETGYITYDASERGHGVVAVVSPACSDTFDVTVTRKD